MKTVKNLLKFDFNPDAFAHSALQPMKIKQDLSDLLEKIVDTWDSKNSSSNQEIERQTYLLFIDTSPKELFTEFDTPSKVRKLSRVLTYAEDDLPRIIDTPNLKYALQLIDNHFSVRAMRNVFDALLQTWDTANAPMLQAFIKKHLTNYEGTQKAVLRLKSDMAWYCENDGAIQLARHFSRSQRKLSDVCSYLELSDSIYGYRYFSAVAEALVVYNKYCEHPNNVKGIVNFLTKHKNRETDRTVLTRLIEQLGANGSEDLRQPIRDYILGEWEDPRSADAPDYWCGVNEETWQIFRRWFMKEDLCFFYDIVAKRSKRKDSWLRYFGKISSIRIVLGRNAERLFKNNRYYQKQKAGMAKLKYGKRNQHALIIQMGHWTFVEFSQENICYIYDNVDHRFNLNELEYDIQKLADKSRAQESLIYNNSVEVKLQALINREVPIHLLPNSQLGKW